MVDPDQVHDVVDMTDRIAQGRFFGIFVDESFVEAYLCDTSLFGLRGWLQSARAEEWEAMIG